LERIIDLYDAWNNAGEAAKWKKIRTCGL